MRKKFILLTGSVCICLIGVTYSYWTDTLHIQQTVTTGELNYMVSCDEAITVMLSSLDGEKVYRCDAMPTKNEDGTYIICLQLGTMNLETLLVDYPKLNMKIKLESANKNSALAVNETIDDELFLMTVGEDSIVWKGSRQILMNDKDVNVIYDLQVANETYIDRCESLREKVMTEIEKTKIENENEKVEVADLEEPKEPEEIEETGEPENVTDMTQAAETLPTPVAEYLDSHIGGSLDLCLEQYHSTNTGANRNNTYCYWTQELKIKLEMNIKYLYSYHAEVQKDEEDK